MTLRERLRTLADGLPANGSVSFTRSDLEEMLGEHESSGGLEPGGPDLTVAQVAERFDREPPTVRDWIRRGKLQAYRFNTREYRITLDALAEFEERQRNGHTPDRKRADTDLTAWRNV